MISEALSALTSVAGGLLAFLMFVTIPAVAVSAWRQHRQASILARLLHTFYSLEAMVTDRLESISREFEQDEAVPPLVRLTLIVALAETRGAPWRVLPIELIELNKQVRDLRGDLTEIPAHLFWRPAKIGMREYPEVEARVNRGHVMRQLAEMEAIEATASSHLGYL